MAKERDDLMELRDDLMAELETLRSRLDAHYVDAGNLTNTSSTSMSASSGTQNFASKPPTHSAMDLTYIEKQNRKHETSMAVSVLRTNSARHNKASRLSHSVVDSVDNVSDELESLNLSAISKSDEQKLFCIPSNNADDSFEYLTSKKLFPDDSSLAVWGELGVETGLGGSHQLGSNLQSTMSHPTSSLSPTLISNINRVDGIASDKSTNDMPMKFKTTTEKLNPKKGNDNMSIADYASLTSQYEMYYRMSSRKIMESNIASQF